jgi:hypothetical protein
MLGSQIDYPCCETFIEPQVSPPFHGYKIAKPLMSQFMCHSNCDLKHRNVKIFKARASLQLVFEIYPGFFEASIRCGRDSSFRTSET